MEKVFENEEVRRRISQASSLRQRRRTPEVEVDGSQQAQVVPKKEPLVGEMKPSESATKAIGLVQVNGALGDHVAPKVSSKPVCEDEEDYTAVSPLGVSKFESKYLSIIKYQA